MGAGGAVQASTLLGWTILVGPESRVESRPRKRMKENEHKEVVV